VRVSEVELSYKSLNSGDAFILDNGTTLYQWHGSKVGVSEKGKATQLSSAIHDEREGKAKVVVVDEGREPEEFWKVLGEKGPIAAAVPDDQEAVFKGEKKLFRLTDSSGKLESKQVGEGKIHKSALDSNDVFILDNGAEVFAWIGAKASVQERKKALQYAQDYLQHAKRPPQVPISRVLEGGENEVFNASFD